MKTCAWKAATTGYPGPVHLALPVDIMFSSFPEDAGLNERPFDRTDTPVPRAWPDPSALAPILDTIQKAKRPLIIAGHGVWWSRSEAQLSAAGNALRIPVYNVPYHTKNLGESSECYMGLADFHQYHPSKPAIHEADVVVMIGCRLDNQMNFGNPPFIPENTKLVCVNGSHEELDYLRAPLLELDEIEMDPESCFGYPRDGSLFQNSWAAGPSPMNSNDSLWSSNDREAHPAQSAQQQQATVKQEQTDKVADTWEDHGTWQSWEDKGPWQSAQSANESWGPLWEDRPLWEPSRASSSSGACGAASWSGSSWSSHPYRNYDGWK